MGQVSVEEAVSKVDPCILGAVHLCVQHHHTPDKHIQLECESDQQMRKSSASLGSSIRLVVAAAGTHWQAHAQCPIALVPLIYLSSAC